MAGTIFELNGQENQAKVNGELEFITLGGGHSNI